MANETEKRWAERVAEWRASGQTSTEFCEGRGFTAGGLRHWAYRLRKGGAKTTALARSPAIRMLRVERVTNATASSTPVGAAALTIELGAARLAVPAGFDGATLRTVLEVLVATEGRS